jgi:hypothetical protein
MQRHELNSLALAACLALSAGAAMAQVPSVPAAPHTTEWLQTGNANDAYWMIDNRWGQGSIPNGGYSQGVGVANTVGSNGEVAFRMNWSWPQGTTEVKGYPALLYGKKPGYASTSNLVDGLPVKLTDGSTLQQSPSGYTPGTIFPKQLPLASMKAKVAFQHNATPTGQGHLTFDIWLQSNPKQDAGWSNSSITHEIMIPLANWGNYGGHNVPGGRNPAWYDHDATIAGKLYHVYITKDSDGCSRYNFGSLNGTYGKTGWKMIAFVPDQLPVAAGEIDLAAIINYLATRKDACGSPWALGNEYLVSAELGVEPVVGTGDITVYNYKISTGSTTSTGTTSGSTSGTTSGTTTGSTSGSTSGSTTATTWVQGQQYAAGAIVNYNGSLYIAKYANPGYNPTISTYYWAPYTGTTASGSTGTTSGTTSGSTTGSTGTYAAYSSSTTYTTGNIVSYNGQLYVARGVNFNNIAPTDTRYWSVYTSTTSGTTTTASTCSGVTTWVQGKSYAAGAIVSYNGSTYYAKYANPGYNPTISTYYWAPKAC